VLGDEQRVPDRAGDALHQELLLQRVRVLEARASQAAQADDRRARLHFL
jgi:hypothetical protein